MRPLLLTLRPGPFSAIWFATALLFLLSWVWQPASVSHGSISGMLPFAAILAIAAIGQTLVIQQGGIDLSVPGVLSITVVLITHYPSGNSSKLPVAIAVAYGVSLAAGLISGLCVSRIGITPIVTTLGMNALLYGGVLAISHGTPQLTTPWLQHFANNKALGVPVTVFFAVAVTVVVGFLIKRTVLGRRFEAVGANAFAARATGLEANRYQLAAYVGATFLYCTAGILLAGVVVQPSAFQGDSYLLPSVAAVVLGGTSLLGGIGSVTASAGGALFLTQLQQLVFTSGANAGVQLLIEAGAIAGGVAFHSIREDVTRWSSLFRRPVDRPELSSVSVASERR